MPNNIKNVTIEDATIAFRNFAGKGDMYNAEGNRNFAILLDEVQAMEMAAAGWNIKRLKPRDDDEIGQPYIQVKVSFKNKPPRVAMVTSKNVTYLEESQVEILDWVDIEIADVTITPYEWAVGAKSGIAAYVKSLFVKIEEDYLQTKWTAYVEEQKAIEAPRDYMDAEIVEDREAIEA